MTRHRLLVPAALAGSVLLGLWFGRAVIPVSADPTELAVQKRLLCPQCTGVRLDTCDLTLCQDMKADIHRRVQEGESEDEIVDAYAAAYGPTILTAPTGLAQTSVWLSWLLAAVAVALLAAHLGIHRRQPELLDAPA